MESTLLPPKPAQEVAIDSSEPPRRYIRKEVDERPIDDSSSSALPVIDLHILSSSSSSMKEKEEEMEKLKDALVSFGFFQAVGHGISSSLLDEVFSIAKEFFNMPMEEKKKCERPGIGSSFPEGYGNDQVDSEDQVFDWMDRLYLLVKPEDQRNLKFWPENPTRFRDVLHEYSSRTSALVENIFKAMAEVLGLEENSFLNQMGNRGPVWARFNYYPPCPRPDLVYGIKPHTDGVALTILLQDKEVEGLQVLKDDKWIKVPVISEALVVNVGDFLEIMSNGRFTSALHRVVTNQEKERNTLAMFFFPEFERDIGPVEALISESKPRVFKNVNVKTYLDSFFGSYSEGNRAIDLAKV